MMTKLCILVLEITKIDKGETHSLPQQVKERGKIASGAKMKSAWVACGGTSGGFRWSFFFTF